MAKLDVEKITWSFIIAFKNTFIFLKKTWNISYVMAKLGVKKFAWSFVKILAFF